MNIKVFTITATIKKLNKTVKVAVLTYDIYSAKSELSTWAWNYYSSFVTFESVDSRVATASDMSAHEIDGAMVVSSLDLGRKEGLEKSKKLVA